MRERVLLLAMYIAAMAWSASVTASQILSDSSEDSSIQDGVLLEGEDGLPCFDDPAAPSGQTGHKMHKNRDCPDAQGGPGGRRRRPSQTARRYQPLPRLPLCPQGPPCPDPATPHRALLLLSPPGLQRERLRRCAATERVEGSARLKAALPRSGLQDAMVVVHAAPDWPPDAQVLDAMAERLGNVSVFAHGPAHGAPHGASYGAGHAALSALVRHCRGMGARCSRLDSLLPVLTWLAEEARPGAPTLPLDQYDARWISAGGGGAGELGHHVFGGDLLDAVLPEPPSLEPPEPLGAPAADGDVPSHEVAVHASPHPPHHHHRLQMSVHKQLEQLVSRLCDRDRSRNHFLELHPAPPTEEDLLPTMAPETALSLRDILPINPKHYDKNRAPKLAGQPTIVYFHVTVLSLDSINEESMTYVADIFLAQSWRDPRLRLPENMSEEYRILDVEWLHDIWRPDCFFKNAKKVTFHEMSIPNHYLWLYHDKTLLYMSKLTLVLSCAMKFESYPHDTQICSMSIESLSHTVHDLVFIWNMTDPLVVNPEIELPQLDISNNYTADCTIEYSTGNFTCLAVVFNLKRRLGYHLFHSYIPSALIVIMSWISFWIKPEAIPARVTLGVTSLLTLATQNTQSQQSLPPVSYVKAIDVWMSSCSVFVFLSLMEFAVVNNYMGPVATKVMKGYSEEDIRNAVEDLKELEPRARSPLRQSVPTVPQYDTFCHGRETALYIDKFSRFFFPFSFFILNVVYWSTFL